MTDIHNRCYIPAWDGEVANKPLARKLCSEPIVMYRKLNGSVVAIRDACPHQGTETSCHYFWGMARNFRIHGQGLTERIKTGQNKIFHKDIDILEGQQKSVADNPDMPLRVLSIDSGGAHARKVISKLMEHENG